MHAFRDKFGTCHIEIITRDHEDWAMEELFVSVSYARLMLSNKWSTNISTL